MVITGRKGRGKGDVKIIRVEGEKDKELEVIVRHETVPRKKERSMWSWQEEFAIEWSESLIKFGDFNPQRDFSSNKTPE